MFGSQRTNRQRQGIQTLWGGLPRLLNRLRNVQGTSVSEEAIEELKSFLKPINVKPLKGLGEVGEDLLALWNVPNTLLRLLLSTKTIENSFLRRHR